MFLLDSNILIYSAQHPYSFLRKYISEEQNSVSAISLIEVLGYWKLIPKDKTYFKACFELLEVLPVSDEVIAESVNLRSKYKMNTADAIIAATCNVYKSN
jgi:predicted nucleic acid-binding protein